MVGILIEARREKGVAVCVPTFPHMQNVMKFHYIHICMIM